jgi:hypothetical protein
MYVHAEQARGRGIFKRVHLKVNVWDRIGRKLDMEMLNSKIHHCPCLIIAKFTPFAQLGLHSTSEIRHDLALDIRKQVNLIQASFSVITFTSAAA